MPRTPIHAVERPRPPAYNLRGDPITGDRYVSKAFMELEWEHVWTRTWQIGGRASDLPEPGDFITHEIGRESILMVRQEDGSIRAFYNVCQHRGNRLVQVDAGFVKQIICAYHGWAYSWDGVVRSVQDENDFPQGSPCNKLKLAEIHCSIWAGFVWFNMDSKAPSLAEFLHPLADQLDAYDMDSMIQVVNLTAEVACNWKVIEDNFSESYHVATLHPELTSFVDDDPANTDFELFESGHNRMTMKGALPSPRAVSPLEPAAPLDAVLRQWDLDPVDFAGRAREARLALQQQKRRLGPARGYGHYEALSDAQLTDYQHCTLFPNTTLTCSSDGVQLLRPRPHPTDPEKCLFDHWFIVPVVDGLDQVETPVGPRPQTVATHEQFKHGEQSMGFVADQDLSIAIAQQRGLASRGYVDCYLSGQEDRVRRFHETINDYIAGRR